MCGRVTLPAFFRWPHPPCQGAGTSLGLVYGTVITVATVTAGQGAPEEVVLSRAGLQIPQGKSVLLQEGGAGRQAQVL